MTAGPVGVSMLGSAFRVWSDDPRMRELVALLWAPFLSDFPADAGTTVEVRTVPGGWRVDTTDYPGAVSHDPWTIAAVLRNLLGGRSIRGAPALVPLHGAAVERNGTFLVLSGPARSGKTTLMLELLDRGWTYVTDDLIPIEPDGLTARPFPKPLSVREPELWQRFAGRWPVPAWLPPPGGVGLIPGSAFRTPDREEYRPTVLLFPAYSPGAPAQLQALSPAAAVALAADNLHVPSQDPRALGTLARVGKTAPAYAVRYGSTEGAVEILENTLAVP